MPPGLLKINKHNTPGHVLILAGEESKEQTIVRRLKAAEADLRNVTIIDEVKDSGTRQDMPVALPRDIPLIEKTIKERHSVLLIVDPVNCFLEEKIDPNSDASTRSGLLHHFKKMAERTGIAILLIRHFNKKAGTPTMYRGGGSIAWTAACRTSHIVGPVPGEPNKKVLAQSRRIPPP